jgi:hypothetical protein
MQRKRKVRTMYKRLLFTLGLASLLVMSVTGLAIAAPGGVTDADALKELAKVRQATAKYHDVNAALEDGFVSTIECTAEPSLGAMGIHYVNIGRMLDPGLDPAAPEALLYMPSTDGPRLVGVEYFYAIGGPDAPIPNPAPPAPSLFGRTFDGPMPGHDVGQPPHYDLHVWLWQANPSGMFAPWNPSLSCP